MSFSSAGRLPGGRTLLSLPFLIIAALLVVCLSHGCSSQADIRASKFKDLCKADKMSELVTYCDECLKEAPGDAETYAYRAFAELALGKKEAAKADMQKALSISPEVGWYHREMGNIYLYCGENKEALSSLLEAKRLPGDSASLYSVYSGMAVANERLGNFAEAIRNATESLRLRPEQKYTYETRAMAYLYSYELDKSLADSAKGISLNRDNPTVYTVHGWASLLKGDIKTAKTDCSIALSLNPKCWQAADLEMAICLFEGDYSGAVKVAERSIANYPDAAQGYAGKSDCLFIMKDFKQAGQFADKAMELEPASVRAICAALVVKSQAGEASQSEALLKKLEKLESSVILKRERARSLFFLGKYQEAVSQCTEAIAVDERNPTSYRLRAEALRRLGRIQEAERDMKEAYERGYPKNALLDLFLRAV